jgi:cytoskeletal protein CcmA (bactofilin family)
LEESNKKEGAVMSKSGEEKMREYEKRLRETTISTTRVSGSGKVNIPGMGEMRISGSGYVSPEEIRISGSGYLPGGIKVERIKCSGSVSIGGDIESVEAQFSGSASVAGSVNAKHLSASGSFRAEGHAKGESMRFSGSCRIRNEIKLEDSLIAHGSLTVLGNVTAQKLVELSGCFDIDGKLTTSTFKAELSRSTSHIKNGIQADYVDVRKREKVEGFVLFGIPIFGKRFREGKLSTTDIVGKEQVYLENVSCNNLTGKDITIGEGCEIKGKIRYSGTIEIHPTAKLSNTPEKVC